MLALVIALAAITQQAPPRTTDLGQTAWIFSTIDNSEFCPAGNVRLDLKTGRYELTQGAPRQICNQANLERPSKSATLPDDQLAKIRDAYLRVLNEGLESEICREGKHPEEIIVNNGGTPIVVLTTGKFSTVAPEDLACWTDAANAFYDLLDTTFGSIR